MAVDKKALNIEMLKIAGFTCTGGIWTYPDGVDVDNGVPFFPGDETACFKWIVPKLRYCDLTKMDELSCDGHFRASVRSGEGIVGDVGHGEDKDPAIAFCLAMRELKK